MNRAYLADIKIRSLVAHEVIPTEASKAAAAMTQHCLNCESPNVIPRNLFKSMVLTPYPARCPIAIILVASGSQCLLRVWGRACLPQADPFCCFGIGRVSIIRLRQDDWTAMLLVFGFRWGCNLPTRIDGEIHQVNT